MKALSYSELSSFLWNKEEWKSRYIDGVTEPPNDKMVLGKIVHKALEDDKYPWKMALKELPSQNPYIIRQILNKMMDKRPPLTETTKGGRILPCREVRVTAETKDGTKLLAYWDGFNREGKILFEYKTSAEVGQWQPWKVDYNRQLSMYAYLYMLKWHSFFREIRLFFLNTEKGTVETFITARDRMSIDRVAKEIKDAVAEMKSLGLWELRKTTAERNALANQKLPL